MPVQNNKDGNLRLDKVTKRFGAFTAVDTISLSIRAGDLFSILGPSGSGKTTVLRMIAGFEVPTSGKIFIGGEDITDLPPHKRQVNTIFQNYSLFPHLSVFENVAFGLKMKKVPPKQIKERVDSMLDTANLLRHAGKYPHQISGGEKQRVAIIRALINKPQILLLDEPVSALDPKLRQKMLVELINIHDQAGITFIYITHDQSEAMSISDRMALMNAGKIVQTGSPREVWEHPNSLFSASFLGDANLFTGKVTALENDYITFRSQLDDYVLLVHSGFHIPLEVGQEVTLSLRAEKIFISKERPVSKPGLNILSGYVEDIFYLGTHIQFIIRLGPRAIKVSAFSQRPGDDEETLTWNERVYISWQATDSVIISELPSEG